MGITEILNSGADVTLKIKSKDLKDFAEELVEKTSKYILNSLVKSDDEYLTIKNTAEILHVHINTLSNWHKNGYLRRIEVGGKRLYRKSDVYAMINRK